MLCDFELEDGIAYLITLCQNSRFFIFPALSGFEPTTPLQLTRKSCHGLYMVCLSRTVSFLPKSDTLFGCKTQKTETTCHVQQAHGIW